MVCFIISCLELGYYFAVFDSGHSVNCHVCKWWVPDLRFFLNWNGLTTIISVESGLFVILREREKSDKYAEWRINRTLVYSSLWHIRHWFVSLRFYSCYEFRSIYYRNYVLLLYKKGTLGGGYQPDLDFSYFCTVLSTTPPFLDGND